jgi:hypothetical protein
MSTIKLTLEQVKKELKPDSRIYYSSGSLWWTHSDQDVKESTAMGIAAQKKLNERFMADPGKTSEEKERMKSLTEALAAHQEKYGTNTPLDPYGCTLLMCDADKWINTAEQKPEHFGKYQLEALMKVHHQNDILKSSPYVSWQDVTDHLDGYYSVHEKLSSK